MSNVSKSPAGIVSLRHPERRNTSYVRQQSPEQLWHEPKDLGEAATPVEPPKPFKKSIASHPLKGYNT